MFLWTRHETILFIVLTTAFVAAYYFFDLDWLVIPWTPFALVGTALAFVISFQIILLMVAFGKREKFVAVL